MRASKAQQYFRAVIQISPYGICVTDAAGSIILANKAAEEITGHATEDLIGAKTSLYYPEGAPRPEIDELRLGSKVKKEFTFTRGDGSRIPVIVHYRHMKTEDGEEIIVEFYSDQSDRKRLDRLKNEFVFVAAHELRNPVTAVKLLLDLIFEDRRLHIDPVMRGYLSKMQEAEDRLTQLVEDLLEVSRTEAGRLKIQVGPQDIGEHVATIFNELKPSAVGKDVTLKYKPLPGVPKVLADGAKLKEIIANLVSNGIKYNVAGGSVTVEHEVGKSMLVTKVRDTGIGIDEKDQKRLFEKFWRSEDMAVRAQAGTGLGLFIVKELVERMGGWIAVSSQRGKGSVFSFSLPIAKE
jgi:PAS domain S-box-containing protein